MRSFWEPKIIPDGGARNFQLGPLDFWARRLGLEWRLATRRDQDAHERRGDRVVAAPENWDLEWRRWILGENVDRLRLIPVMPDRPIIVRPEMPVSILPKQAAKFFVGVPVFIRVALGKNEATLCEEPTAILSNSWFGETYAGELCYALKTMAKVHPNELGDHPYRAVCPIQIKNEQDEILEFKRLCLQVHYLDIHQGQTRLWTNLCKISYSGSDKSRFNYEKHAPEFDGEQSLVGKSRKKQIGDMVFKAFDFFSK